MSESLMQSLMHLSPNANDDLKNWLHSLKVGNYIKSPQLATTLSVIKDTGVDGRCWPNFIANNKLVIVSSNRININNFI